MSNPLKSLNSYVGPLLTDYYQISMAYAYWKLGKHDHSAVFDLFFRRNPFHGEFTVFAGLNAAMKYLQDFKFTENDILYLRNIMQRGRVVPIEDEFFQWLSTLSTQSMRIYSMKEGTICFPLVPLLRVEGPLALCQIIETTLLNLINFGCLITTNAVRYRLAAGPNKRLLEFGLRRAQGPDGAMSASRYAFIGGFDATSNIKAAQTFDIECCGTHSHAFITSFRSLKDIGPGLMLYNREIKENEDLIEPTCLYLKALCNEQLTNEGELAAFIALASTHPTAFMGLVDTYNTLNSGLPNFVAVALTLIDFGYKPLGIRIDSGDLAYLSNEARAFLNKCAKTFGKPALEFCSIVASNEINEQTLLALNQQGHQIDAYGIGTNFITCQGQTSLGGVYKIACIKDKPCLKISNEKSKVSIPGQKNTYRLYDSHLRPIIDLICESSQKAPESNEKIMCRHPFDESMRAFVIPTKVVPLYNLVWEGKLVVDLPTDQEIKEYVQEQVLSMRKDHLRFINPTPYKVSVSEQLYLLFHELWMNESPVPCLQ